MQKKLLAFAMLIFVQQSSFASSSGLETVGDIGQILVPAAALAATLYHKDKEGAWQFTKSYATTMGAVYILKPVVDRKRPNGGSGSFPSGHTASAFAGAAFLQRRYGWTYGIPAYALASVVGYSRVDADKHFTTDVIAGAAIGIGMNLIFTDRFKENVTVQPYVQSDEGAVPGVHLALTW